MSGYLALGFFTTILVLYTLVIFFCGFLFGELSKTSRISKKSAEEFSNFMQGKKMIIVDERTP